MEHKDQGSPDDLDTFAVGVANFCERIAIAISKRSGNVEHPPVCENKQRPPLKNGQVPEQGAFEPCQRRVAAGDERDQFTLFEKGIDKRGFDQQSPLTFFDLFFVDAPVVGKKDVPGNGFSENVNRPPEQVVGTDGPGLRFDIFLCVGGFRRFWVLIHVFILIVIKIFYPFMRLIIAPFR